MNIQHSIDLAKQWILYSSIQTLNNLKGVRFFGSFSSWFDLHNKNYPFVYSEITGYGMTTLLFLNHLAPDEALIKRAEFAAAWLTDVTKTKDGGFRCVISHEENSFQHKEHQAYTFDAGVILNGFVNLYRATQKETYIRTAQQIFDWFTLMTDASGQLQAVYDTKKQEVFHSDETWSTQPGSFLAKNAIGLLNLYDITKQPAVKQMAINLCNTALRNQDPSGRFICHTSGHTNIHPHSYTAEGLLCAGLFLNNEEYLNSALRATQWVLQNQQADGAIPRLFLDGSFNYHQRVDGIAQTLRLGTILRKNGYLNSPSDPHLHKLLTNLLPYQSTRRDLNQEGGFTFGFTSTGELQPHVNSWCSMFALQALTWHLKEDISPAEITRFFI